MTVTEIKIQTMLELSKQHWILEEKIQKIEEKMIKHKAQALFLFEHPALTTLCKLKQNNAHLWFAILNPKKYDESFFDQKKEQSTQLLQKASQEVDDFENEAKKILEKLPVPKVKAKL